MLGGLHGHARVRPVVTQASTFGVTYTNLIPLCSTIHIAKHVRYSPVVRMSGFQSNGSQETRVQTSVTESDMMGMGLFFLISVPFSFFGPNP